MTPELIPAAIEEQLRFGFTSSRVLPNGHPRLPHRYGHDPGRGARTVLFAAANRDPRHYDDPDIFDLNRTRPSTLRLAVGPTTASAHI